MKRQPSPWDDHDTQFVALAAVRYCHGRASYAPGLVCDWVKRHWKDLEVNTRAVIARDTREALADAERAGGLLGMDMDHREWVEFLCWMEENEHD